MKLPNLLAASAIALSAGAMSAQADKADDTLRLAFTKELETVDIYFNSAREGILLARAIWDGLLYRDPVTGEYKGNLATEWKWIDDVTLELKLREGVTFHNGEPFNADDVVYTVNYVANPDNGIVVQRNVSWMDRAEKVDDYTVRIILDAPFPPAEEFLAGPVVMYPNEYYAEVGPAGMALNPIGTGPYKVSSVDPGLHYELEAFDGYHGDPRNAASIGKIDIRTIPDFNTQIAEFFNGQLDFLWNVPADQAEKLDAMGKYQVENAEAIRIGFISMDASGRADADGPMTNPLVRKAVAHAIDRQAIVDALVKGSSEVVHSACAKIQFACEQDVAQYEYNPEKAKALLAEAGYPDGFEIDFHAYRNRPYAEAMMGFLDEVGIKTNLVYLKYSALRDARSKGEVPFTFQTWGSYSLADASAIVGEHFTGGMLDDAKDAEVTAWVNEADSTTDKDKRIGLYSKALKKIADEAYWLPLWSYNVNYVMSQEVSYAPTNDEIVRFFDFSWK
ncbi:Glutathione-binding protein GsiB precursor [Pelagimonas phthalicica]|uniref:Glutathione-binding protein GsiB n=1 Tax=Pelagimonas phthalicica TaxID=1037362 RepID=A0A238JBC9_9RHOB|nr:ABC transporter substrate-binding protein [Pelagimonas phthalicica]TDS93570.1 peptide/nickel transport system substrate-binding protein [Pelagimonas phthalicica]SMX27909.1 Glutathione-binding protein GsiB precursor [Pelagimonas phthalicica]